MKKEGMKTTRQELDLAAQFPEIEKLMESEDFSKVNKQLGDAYHALEKLSRGKGGLGKSSEARKGMKAIERVMDLLRELLKMKYKLMESEVPTSPQKK
jgi:hypothetical protein